MPSEPRTIRGPCFDCNDPGDFSCWCGWGDTEICACHSPLGERTAPIPKIEPETRPNVPPRMTDEQYIDDLFAREGIGWDKTPGFRAFVLDLMGVIGERPRAGDVSSMHLAYTAGLEHGKEWTDERPTEPGEYWLSLHPDKRQCHAPVLKVILEHNRTDSLHVRVVGDDAGWLGLSCGGWLDGAKWSRRETPADPFEEG